MKYLIMIIITVYYAIKGSMNAYKQDNIKEQNITYGTKC